MDNITFVGLDMHKATVCVALAESGRDGEVRQVGVLIPGEAAHPFRDIVAPRFREILAHDSGVSSPGIEGVTGPSAGCI
jgi:hypothetical protein